MRYTLLGAAAAAAIAVVLIQQLKPTVADDRARPTADQPRAEFVLDLPYGTGQGCVGSTRAHEPDKSAPPMCPEMFQMTADGTLWVLDTVNSRVLSFKDGSQTAEISTLGFRKSPALFGVTGGAVFVARTAGDNGPVGLLLRCARGSSARETVRLELADGTRFLPLRVMPLGAEGNALLLNGTRTSPEAGASAVVDDSGSVTRLVQDDRCIPAPDGSVWRLRAIEDSQPSEVTFALEKYNTQTQVWDIRAQGSLPRRAELYAQRKRPNLRPIGVDQEGGAVAVLLEGKPLSPRFIRVTPTGAVAAAVTLEDLGFDSKPLTRHFATEHYQLLADGSVLAQYATPERYRIIRIHM